MAETCYDFPEFDPKDFDKVDDETKTLFERVAKMAEDFAKIARDVLFGWGKNENKK